MGFFRRTYCNHFSAGSGADPFEEGVEELARNPSFPEAFQDLG